MRSLISAALGAVAFQLVSAHYTFPGFIANGSTTADWQYVRITANRYSNGPVTNVNDPEFRCYELDLVNTASATGIATVAAGDIVGFKPNNPISHPGYFSAYMTPASPAANSEAAGSGKTWYKIWEWAPTWSKATGLVFASEYAAQVNFTIPKATKSGQYLIRIEHIALHISSSYGGAQFYIGCAQVNVVDGGSGTPPTTVSIPGVYTGYEPGILLNIYNLPANFTGYVTPGPAVWSG